MAAMSDTAAQASGASGPMDPMAEVRIENVSKSYTIGPTREQVLDQCSLTLAAGKLTVLIGPSGCGKSTLINI
ncbi:MAG: ATP-binding cassette domain-containing protein, partial [Hyphomicrobium sp.]